MTFVFKSLFSTSVPSLFAAVLSGIAVLVAGCADSSVRVPGDPCLNSADCAEEDACFETRGSGDPVCMETCDETTRLCDTVDREVCLPGPSGTRVCYIGGDLPLNADCADGGDCDVGLVCVNANGETKCKTACDTRVGNCGDLTCLVVGAEPAGYCGLPPAE